MSLINQYLNKIIHGDCVRVMRDMPDNSINLIVTDPPYLVNYRDREGRGVANDDWKRTAWLRPAYAEMYRVLKPDSFCVSFLGFTQAEKFILAWNIAGFRMVEHFVWKKRYASSTGYAKRHHEAAYLLTKGRPDKPRYFPPTVLDWSYTGNKLHPTQKPVMSLVPLIKAYSKPGDVVLDPFIGSGTTAVAAKKTGRDYIGIELSEEYYRNAVKRLQQFYD